MSALVFGKESQKVLASLFSKAIQVSDNHMIRIVRIISAIDQRQKAIREELAARPEHADNPLIQEAAKTPWSEDVLEPTIRSFKAGLVHAIHKTLEEIPEGIRPREEFKDLTKALHRQMSMGWPDVPISVAFMPGGVSRSQPDGTRLRQRRVNESQACQRLKQLGEEGSISDDP